MRVPYIFSVFARIIWISLGCVVILIIVLNLRPWESYGFRIFGWPRVFGDNAYQEMRWRDDRGVALGIDAVVALSMIVTTGVLSNAWQRRRVKENTKRLWQRLSPISILAILLSISLLIFANYFWADVRSGGDETNFVYGWPLDALFVDAEPAMHLSAPPNRSWDWDVTSALINAAVGICLVIATATCVEALVRLFKTKPKFSLQTAMLAVLFSCSTVLLWNSHNSWTLFGTPITSPSPPAIAARALTCAVCQPDGSISILDITTGACRRDLRIANVTLLYPALSPDGKRLFAMSFADGQLAWWFWNTEDGKLLSNGFGYGRCIFSPDGNRTLLLHSFGETQQQAEPTLINTISGKPIAEIGSLNGEGNAVFSFKSNLLAVAGKDSSKCALFNSVDGTALGKMDFDGDIHNPIISMAFSPEDRYLLVSGWTDYNYPRSKIIKIIDTRSLRTIALIPGSLCPGADIFANRGHGFVVKSENDKASIYDIDGRKPRFDVHVGYTDQDNDARICETRLGIVDEGCVKIRDVENGALLAKIRTGGCCKTFDFISEDKLAAISDNFVPGQPKWTTEVFHRQRPERWYGWLVLPQFWLVIIFGAALVRSLRLDMVLLQKQRLASA